MQREGDVLRIASNYGFSREAVQYALEHPLRPDRGSATGRAAVEGKPIHIPDVLAEVPMANIGVSSIRIWFISRCKTVGTCPCRH